MWLDCALVAGYLAVLLFIGLRGGRQVKNTADFTAHSGRYGVAVIFATLAASYIGGGFSSGNASEAFSHGIGSTLALMGFALAMMGIGRFLVGGVARFRGVTTVGGILELDYGWGARVLCGLFSFLSCAGVVAAQMEAMGLTFRTLLGVPDTVGILIGFGIVVVYTTFGGMQSVIAADMVQFLLLAVGMPLLLIGGLHRAGGIGAVVQALPAAYWNPLNGTTLWGFLSLFVSLAVGEALAPPYTQRLLLGRTPAVTARATILSGAFAVPFFAVTGLIGLTAFALNPLGDAATAMPRMILTVLPVGLRGLVMAAMVSIILSAADGFLNGATVGLVCDCVLPLFPKTSPVVQLRLLRYSNLLIGAAAVGLSLWLPNIFDILLVAYSFWCPVMLVPLAAAFRGVRVSRRGFFCAVGAGLFSSLFWTLLLGEPFGIHGSVVGLLINAGVFFCFHAASNTVRNISK
ncbi:MAG: sodium:solute symporter family protein [Ruminococcaceae bacterium]|nr:sodium:solute symporter family protein [Oscillospiraceae bacterium]